MPDQPADRFQPSTPIFIDELGPADSCVRRVLERARCHHPSVVILWPIVVSTSDHSLLVSAMPYRPAPSLPRRWRAARSSYETSTTARMASTVEPVEYGSKYAA